MPSPYSRCRPFPVGRTPVATLAAAAAAIVTMTGCGLLAAQSDVLNLDVGDCIADQNLQGEISDIELVHCEDPHFFEVYAVRELPDGPYPGDQHIATEADEFCYTEFAPFIGNDYETSVIEFDHLTPTEQSWDRVNDRDLVCLAFELDGSQVEGTLQNANR
ncbi:septum formation family protein [Lipingzhangella sp. LS1_29]|uniref:Septum formation family protein n=1 Tax=Lipingzhangella rawalii TaxID=2055835 RepID=A0ABU2H2L9_9ACTN|nr:septum formation family protein [Lipingzhangella rawalii]MDS1269547.1 septum formation family protein [Lipingzhangella rawalii]